MAGRLAPSEKRHIPAIGPGAHKRPGGRYLAEQGKRRKAPMPSYRKTYCGGRPACPGHVDVADGSQRDVERCA